MYHGRSMGGTFCLSSSGYADLRVYLNWRFIERKAYGVNGIVLSCTQVYPQVIILIMEK
jgi:hypothetical protein